MKNPTHLASLLFLILSLCTMPVVAQDPERGAVRKLPAAKGQPQKIDPMVESWIISISKKIADQNPLIRRSAQAGLVTLGKPALPHLERLAAAGDGMVATEARKVMKRIKNRKPPRAKRDKRPPEQGRRQRQGQRPAQRLKRMRDLVGSMELSAESRTKVDGAFRSYMDRVKTVGQQAREGQLDPKERRGAFQKATKELNAALKGTLSEEQYASFSKKLKKMRRGRRRPKQADGE